MFNRNRTKLEKNKTNFVTKLRPVTGTRRSYVCVFYNIKHSTDYVYIPYISIYNREKEMCTIGESGRRRGEKLLIATTVNAIV